MKPNPPPDISDEEIRTRHADLLEKHDPTRDWHYKFEVQSFNYKTPEKKYIVGVTLTGKWGCTCPSREKPHCKHVKLVQYQNRLEKAKYEEVFQKMFPFNIEEP